MQFGMATGQSRPWSAMLDLWSLYESLGFDSLWDFDHFIQPSNPDAPFYDGWTLLAALAARTERARIGVLVTCNAFRHPSLLAKAAVTIDHISGGRLNIGLGSGYFEPEHRMFGFDFPETGELISRFGEAVELIDLLLRNDLTTWQGRHYQVHDAKFRPRPLQKPRPPLVIGAKKPRTLRICARFGNVWNAGVASAQEVREMTNVLAEQCAAVGRDPAEIGHSVYYMVSRLGTDPWSSIDAFQEVVAEYREAGIDEFIVDPAREDQRRVLERVAEDLLPGLRAG